MNKCYCGHEAWVHSSTDNKCLVLGCPCDEGFQHDFLGPPSDRLLAAMTALDRCVKVPVSSMSCKRGTKTCVVKHR
jgi:hypothetical protein